MTKPLIDIQNLVFAYPKHDPLLRIQTFHVHAREHVFLHGPSGCGKSTFLNLLAGVHQPIQGKLEVLGTDLTRLPMRKRDRFRGQHMGYVFQQFNLLPYLTCLDNICLPIRVTAHQDKDWRSRALELAQHLDLTSDLPKYAYQLSVGQQQRVSVARALLKRPQLLIADEPTSALDAERRSQFIHVVRELCDQTGTTLVFVSHDASLSSLFNRHVSMRDINQAG